MNDLLSGLPLGQLSAGALLALLVFLIMTGKYPTPGQLKDAQADRDKWRESAETWQRTATQLGMTLDKLVIYAETTNHAITDIRALAARTHEGTDA